MTNNEYLQLRANMPIKMEQWNSMAIGKPLWDDIGSVLLKLSDNNGLSDKHKEEAQFFHDTLTLYRTSYMYGQGKYRATNGNSYSNLSALYPNDEYLSSFIEEEQHVAKSLAIIITCQAKVLSDSNAPITVAEEVAYRDAVNWTYPTHREYYSKTSWATDNQLKVRVEQENTVFPNLITFIRRSLPSVTSNTTASAGMLERVASLEEKLLRIQKVVGETGPPTDYTDRLDKMEQQIRDLQSLYVNNIDAAIAQLKELQEWAARFNKAIVYVDP